MKNTNIKYEKKSSDWRTDESFNNTYEMVRILCKVGNYGSKVHKGTTYQNRVTKEFHSWYGINSCANNFIRGTGIIKVIDSDEDYKRITCKKCS